MMPTELDRALTGFVAASKIAVTEGLIDRDDLLEVRRGVANARLELISLRQENKRLAADRGAMTELVACLYEVLGGDVSLLEGARRLRRERDDALSQLRGPAPEEEVRR